MVQEAIANLGTVPKEATADAWYYSAQAVEQLDTLVLQRRFARRGP